MKRMSTDLSTDSHRNTDKSIRRFHLDNDLTQFKTGKQLTVKPI